MKFSMVVLRLICYKLVRVENAVRCTTVATMYSAIQYFLHNENSQYNKYYPTAIVSILYKILYSKSNSLKEV